jgi:hypothetical protein
MTTQVFTSSTTPDFRGLSILLHGREPLFRTLWTQLDPGARWRLLASVHGDFDAIRLADVVREVRRGGS